MVVDIVIMLQPGQAGIVYKHCVMDSQIAHINCQHSYNICGQAVFVLHFHVKQQGQLGRPARANDRRFIGIIQLETGTTIMQTQMHLHNTDKATTDTLYEDYPFTKG